MTIDTSQDAKYQLMPPLTPEERAALKADIAHRGVAVAVEFDEDGNLLDGHHRVELWQELQSEGVQLPMYDSVIRRDMDEDTKKNYVLAINLKRRHMDATQKAYLFARLRQPPFNMTLQAIASVASVGIGTVHRHLEMLPDDVRAEIEAISTVGKDGKVYPAKYNPIATATTYISGAKAERDFTSRGYVGSDESAQLTASYMIVVTLTDEAHQSRVLNWLAEEPRLEGATVKAVMS